MTRDPAHSEALATFADSVISAPSSVAEAARGVSGQACYDHGEALWHGTGGLPVDRGEAALWYEQAALKGHPAGMFALAETLRWGDGMLRNPGRAEILYRMAAEAGEARAQHWLAHAYAVGDGVLRDVQEAAKWSRRAGIRANAAWFWILLGLTLGLWTCALAWWSLRP